MRSDARPCRCDRPRCGACQAWYFSGWHRVNWGGPADPPALPAGWPPEPASPVPTPAERFPELPPAAHAHHPPPRLRLNCVRLGPVIRAARCGCAGTSVYACPVKGECFRVRPAGLRPGDPEAGVTDCQSCDAYEAKPAPA